MSPGRGTFQHLVAKTVSVLPKVRTWGVIFAPKGTPEPVLQKLNTAINSILMQPAMVEQRRKLGSSASAPLSLAQSQAFLLKARDTDLQAARRIKPE